MTQTNLIVTKEQFMENYNLDLNPYLLRHTYKESRQKGSKREIFYISWSNAIVLLKKQHPTFDVCFRPTETGSHIHYHKDIDCFEFLPYIRDNATGFESATTSYIAQDPGGYTLTLDKLKKTPTTDQLNKNRMRSIPKVIAVITGIGLSLWTLLDVEGLEREDILEEAILRSLVFQLVFKKSYIPGDQFENIKTQYDVNDLITLNNDLNIVLKKQSVQNLGYIRKIVGYDKQYADKNNGKSWLDDEKGYALENLLEMKTQELIDIGKAIATKVNTPSN